MSQTSDQRSAEFLKIADQFKLGALTTETSHSVTANLSEVAKNDIAAGLKLLLDVDDDVVRKFREFAESGRARNIANTVIAALKNGGNIYFTGCGSTGRLSIQLASIWRDFWQSRRRGDESQTKIGNRHPPSRGTRDSPNLLHCRRRREESLTYWRLAIGDWRF